MEEREEINVVAFSRWCLTPHDMPVITLSDAANSMSRESIPDIAILLHFVGYHSQQLTTVTEDTLLRIYVKTQSQIGDG